MKNIKDYLKQIKLEIKKLFYSKFMIILIGLLVLFSIAVPIISTIDLFGPRYYYGGYSEGDIEIDGITIDGDNMMYWEIYQARESKDRIQGNATDEVDDLAIEYIDYMLEDFLMIAKNVESYEDYRSQVVWSRREYMTAVFILEHNTVSHEDMQIALEQSYIFYMDTSSMKKEYYDLSDEEKQEKLANAKEALELSKKIIVDGDHDAYFGYLKVDYQSRIDGYETEIANLEQAIIDNPDSEKNISEQIDDLRMQIEMYEEISIPSLEYRIAHDIVPGVDDWRDTALNTKESALREIKYNSDILTQAEFEDEQYLKREYVTYAKYKEAMQKRIDEATDRMNIADRSLETGKPDMTYVYDGTRMRVSKFMYYSLVIAVFAVIIGGGLIAREFQTGTVRLLLIRPKSRTKIVISKLLALLIICIAVYAACVLVNLFTNGIIYGFKDLGYPNYTISSGVHGISFFAYIVPKLLACFVVVVFGMCAAYFLSAVTRNTALSVSIPLVAFAGSLIAMGIIGYSEKYKWIMYTPLPYMNMPTILTNNYYSPTGVEPNIAFGIIMLLALSIIGVVAGTIIMGKRDVNN